jgi:P-type Mg2+ transporter
VTYLVRAELVKPFALGGRAAPGRGPILPMSRRRSRLA